MATERRRGGRRAPRSEASAHRRRAARLVATLTAAALSLSGALLSGALAAGASAAPSGPRTSPVATSTTDGSDETAIALAAAPAASGIARPGDPLSV
ncbi:MAG: hypothetical protein ACO1N6_06820, partial [Microcella sp.]